MIAVTVVIPTCNRPDRLRSVLADLSRSMQPILEVIVVDSSDHKLLPADYADIPNLEIRYLESKKSVCVQRNIGIRQARGNWILLCDDDLTVPPDYLVKLVAHAQAHPEAGAVSGRVLEMGPNGWQSEYPVNSSLGLLWRYLFQLGVWGEIRARGPLADTIAERFRREGNHLSRAGWPVIVDFSGDYFRTPVYGLGACLVKREWLLASPYDERLDAHGFGDNYGVALGFPAEGIHVVTDAFVHHHREEKNRLRPSEAYSRRLLALHYFITTRGPFAKVSPAIFLWSLVGQIVFHSFAGDHRFARAALESLATIALRRNPYLRDERRH